MEIILEEKFYIVKYNYTPYNVTKLCVKAPETLEYFEASALVFSGKIIVLPRLIAGIWEPGTSLKCPTVNKT